jgi:hypothetical protein
MLSTSVQRAKALAFARKMAILTGKDPAVRDTIAELFPVFNQAIIETFDAVSVQDATALFKHAGG